MKVKRGLAMLLAIVMIITMLPVSAFAEDGGAAHIHDESCGYVEAVEGHPCEHVHDESCGYSEETPEIPCNMDCTDTDGDGVINHADGCAYTPASAAMPCQHIHNESCGYVKAVEGQPCNYTGTDDPVVIKQKMELNDEESGISVKGIFPSETALTVRPYTNDELADLDIDSALLTMAYDISLGEGVTPEGTMQITLPVPESFTGELSVRRYSDDHTYETVSGEAHMEDMSFQFNSDQTGVYALVCSFPSEDMNENVDVNSFDIPADSAAGIQFAEEDTPAVMSLLGTPEGLDVAKQSEGAWSFGMYYINYAGALATTKDKTTLDLVGNDIGHVDQTVKYQFEFHNSTDYEAGTVSITVPRALLVDRNGNSLNPSDIGVPLAPAVSKNSPFHYTIENVDGVECMVFTNHRKIASGSNNLIQIFYKVNDMKTIDGTTWDIQAAISVNGEASQGNTVLHGSMDTDTSLYITDKTAYTPVNSNIYPELYTWKQVQQWTNLTGEKPADFDDYRYVLWKTHLQGDANQPWNLTITDTPSHNGEVIGQFLYNHEDYDTWRKPFATFDDGTFTLGVKEWYGLDGYYEDIYLYTVVRYPLASFPEDCEVGNHIEATLMGVDDEIAHTLTSDAKHTWEDYDWTYSGDLFGVRKGYEVYNSNSEIPDLEEAWIDAYIKAAEQGADLSLPEHWEVYGYARGYSYIQENAEGSYSFNVLDDVQYIKSNQSHYSLMTPDDYHYGSVVFKSEENNIDIYENETVPAETGTPYSIYVMTSDARGTWQLAAEVPFEQFNGYSLSEEWIKKGVYSVKVEHEVACYETKIYIQGTTVLNHNSELLQDLVADERNTQLDILNVAGAYGEANGELLFADNPFESQYGGTIADDLNAQDLAQYGGYLYRSGDEVRLTRLTGNNNAVKTVTAKNNPVDSRVDLTYAIGAYDAYDVYDESATDLFQSVGISPARDNVTFYDLLPLGVVFDPSKSVYVGQLRSIHDNMMSSGSWLTADISIDWNVTDDYRGSGRQMVAFTLSYTGEKGSNARYDSDFDLWFCGWGVQFGAYYSWEDYALASSAVNVAAFATNTPILGTGYVDDGSGVPDAAGKDDNGQSYYYDPEGDGIAEDPYMIYAQVANNDDVAVAAKANIEKLVKENGDIYGEPSLDASVQLGGKYTYTLQVNNAQGTLKNIVVYDRLEQGRTDHSDYDTRPFEDSDWTGTFAGVSTTAARLKGAVPVVYYSSDRSQPLSLAADGWVESSLWEGSLAEVKAVAVDLTKTASGDDFMLEALDSVKIGITMNAPEEMPEATYAYNVPVFDSISIADDGNESTETGVMGNSTAVTLYEPTSLIVEKQIAEDPAAPANQEFEFTVTMDGQPYANKEYRLVGADNAALPGVHATDINGVLTLMAGQKAIFHSVPANAQYSVRESYMANWKPSPADTITGKLTQGEDTIASFTNTYVYPLYFNKFVEFEQD